MMFLVGLVLLSSSALLAPYLQKSFHWTEADYGWIVFAFELAYTIGMIIAGGVIDWLGTRLGYAISMAWWSVAAASHALAHSVFEFAMARFALGIGEAGNFPASIKGVAEWFPKHERALATGIFNSGTNIGAVAAYPIVGWVFLRWGWQAAFLATGALGVVAFVLWLLFYRRPERHPWVTESELKRINAPELGEEQEGDEPKIPWARLLRYREAWGFFLAKFLTDPIWWFYIFWLPKYLIQARGFSIHTLELFGMIPFLGASIGSVAGGWFSGFLMRRGWSVNAGRKTAMAVCAFSMPTGIIAVFAHSPWLALALITVSTSAHQGWSANIFTLASDMFPKKDIAAVVGIGGAAGAIGGMIIAPFAGYILQWFHSYVPLFIIAGVMHPIALGVVQWLVPRIRQVTLRAH
ncbi:MAG: MFS transporter [Acidobacteriota bacterium]|nr:MFS transporter [Acidobacteriota bacterium]